MVLVDKEFLDSSLENLLGEIDWLFARTIKVKQPSFVLAYLFYVSRMGFLSLQVDEKNQMIEPDFSRFFPLLEKEKEKQLKKLFWHDWPKQKTALVNSAGDISCPVVWEEDKLFLQKNHLYQKKIKEHLLRLKSSFPNFKFPAEFFEKLKQMDNLSNEQKEAIKKSAKNNLSFLWGGPGTGKTFTASILTELFLKFAPFPLKVLSLAPTGKAALHLKNQIAKRLPDMLVEGKTLHAALNLRPQKEIQIEKKLEADLILVDETSMIDARLLAGFLEAVSDQTRVVFLGDPNQLPPVESSDLNSYFQPFKDQTTVLKKSYRFQNSIGKAVHFLEQKQISGFIENLNETVFFQNENVFLAQKKIVARSAAVYEELLKKTSDISGLLEEMKKFRLLSAFKVGPLGTDALNEKLFHLLNRPNLPLPIVVVQNDYAQNLFNGETGLLLNKTAYFKTENQEIRKIPQYMLPSYELGFALSVHKSQGSEYESLFLVLPEGSEILGPKLLYTAATRAKEKLVLFTFLQTLERFF